MLIIPCDTRAAVLAGVIAVAAVAAAPARQASSVDELMSAMTLDEKVSMLHGATDPDTRGQAGYIPGVARLGIPPLRLSDGPAGVRTARPATALPAPVAMASTFSPELARRYGQIIGRDARLRDQDVILAPMVNIVRVPQAGRNFETLGEDPLLASRLVAAEIAGIEAEGVIATVKHFAENNQENQRQSVSADVDERTLHEIELPAFEAAVRAGVGSVMASYNKVNGVFASENSTLQVDILRGQWGFAGWVMSDWGGTHSGGPALVAGLDMEMPSGRYFGALAEAVRSGQVPESAVDQAVRRILTQMKRVGLLDKTPRAKPAGDVPASTPAARDIAIAGAVLLRNDGGILPLKTADFQSMAIIGPTAKAVLVGGGGSARVAPMRTDSPWAALARAVRSARPTYAVGYDLDGVVVPAAQLSPDGEIAAPGLLRTMSRGGAAVIDPVIDRVGAAAVPAGESWTWSGTVRAPLTGDYELKLQSLGGRASLLIDSAATAAAAGAAAPAGRGGGRGGGAGSLVPTADGLTNATTAATFQAGSSHQVRITVAAGGNTPTQVRFAWIVPGWRDTKIAEAVQAARAARTAVIFAYDEGAEGRDRPSLNLPGYQDALVAAVAAANPRTIVVLNNGAPVVMPWANRVVAILQMWYPGQEGAEAVVHILAGLAEPGGRLPVTFPMRAEDAPTSLPERYPGVNGHGAYSEQTFVGYRWYDREGIAPLFPFGHGLSYTRFEYSGLTVRNAGDGCDVSFVVKNTGARGGVDVPQVYLGPPSSPPVPIAARQLAGFERLVIPAGGSRQVTIHIGARELSYWSIERHGWVVASGRRTIEVGASSRDIRLKGEAVIAAPPPRAVYD
jgi:beta-glucosidase